MKNKTRDYSEKIAYWTAQHNRATVTGDIEKLAKALDRLEYFQGRQYELDKPEEFQIILENWITGERFPVAIFQTAMECEVSFNALKTKLFYGDSSTYKMIGVEYQYSLRELRSTAIAISRETVRSYGDKGSCILGYHLLVDGERFISQPAQGSSTCEKVYGIVKDMLLANGISAHRIETDYGRMD